MGLCKPGGGNDYTMCILCGVEYDYRKEPPPPCGKEARLIQLWAQRDQIQRQIDQLLTAKPRDDK